MKFFVLSLAFKQDRIFVIFRNNPIRLINIQYIFKMIDIKLSVIQTNGQRHIKLLTFWTATCELEAIKQ